MYTITTVSGNVAGSEEGFWFHRIKLLSIIELASAGNQKEGREVSFEMSTHQWLRSSHPWPSRRISPMDPLYRNKPDASHHLMPIWPAPSSSIGNATTCKQHIIFPNSLEIFPKEYPQFNADFCVLKYIRLIRRRSGVEGSSNAASMCCMHASNVSEEHEMVMPLARCGDT